MWVFTPPRRPAYLIAVVEKPSDVAILGSGFIGSHLARTLSDVGYSYRLVSSAQCDLTDACQVRRALQDCTGNTSIVMTACVTRLRDNSYAGFNRNVLMAENLAAFLRTNKVRNVVFLSTVDVYGLLEDSRIIHEGLPLRPDDYYSMSKVVSEFILTKACSSQNIPLAILRLTGVYGPGDDGKSAMWKMARSAVDRGTISIYGDGQDKRDFITVQDVAKVIFYEITTPRHHIVNVSTGTSHTIMDIARCLVEYVPSTIEVIPTSDENNPKRAKIMRFNTARLRTEIPEFTPTDLPVGIQQYLRDFTQKEPRSSNVEA